MKTPEEIRKALECCSKSVCCIDCMDLECPYVTRYGHDCMNRMAADALEYIQSLEKEIAEHDLLEDHIRDLTKMMPKWISVKERLPKNGGVYLCCLNSVFRTICYFDGEQWDDSEDAYATHLVTHWMPLPNLPKEDCNG